jgi:putative transposase
MRRRGLSGRRACVLLSVSRSLLGYAPRRLLRDAALLAVMKRLAQQHPRYGYRRIWALLQRQGMRVNHQRVYRLWREHGWRVRVRQRRKRADPPAARPPAARRPHEMWADDVVHDRWANGEALKCLVIVDEYTRLCLAIEVGGRVASGQVIEVLARLSDAHGAPCDIRSDNGPEFVAQAVKAWLSSNGMSTAFIEPGKPWQNGAAESFIGEFRDECLNMEWFRSRSEARVVIEQYRQQYNEERPHSSLGYQTPAAVARGWGVPHPTRSKKPTPAVSNQRGLT